MKIIRNGKNFIVIDNRTIVTENITFDQAREFLALNGNKDAKLPLVSHSNIQRNERWIEIEFHDEVLVHIGREL